MKKRIVLIPTFLLALCVAACSSNAGSNNNSSKEETSTSKEAESSVPQSSSGEANTSNTSAKPNTSTTSRPSSSSSAKPSSSSSARPSSSSQTNTSTSQVSQDYDKVSGNFAFKSGQLNTPQEIHTADQLKYLNFSGDYYHITSTDLNGFNATGRSNVSTPKNVTVNWKYTAPAGKTVSGIKFTYGQKADLSDGYDISFGASATSATFYNPYLGDNYF